MKFSKVSGTSLQKTVINAILFVDDFAASDEGCMKLDPICMLIIAIGESLENIDKITDNHFLEHYRDIDWKEDAKGMRDVISRHWTNILPGGFEKTPSPIHLIEAAKGLTMTGEAE